MHTTAHGQKAARAGAARERQVAARFAPVFRQALGDHPRADYVTNFDFDGDWRGDNNWRHADDTRFPMRAYVYFAVAETPTHFYAHYALFHPRDYKGGTAAGPLLSDAIREGVRRGGRYDPTGLSAEAVLAHENDMEGCPVGARQEAAPPSPPPPGGAPPGRAATPRGASRRRPCSRTRTTWGAASSSRERSRQPSM